jgi:SHS2 domain-containing protein
VYRWIEHTGELELSIEAPSEVGAFEDALAALGELLGEDGGGESASREVSASAPDRPTLLAEWLSELAYLAEREGFVPVRATQIELSPQAIEAAVQGRLANPPHLVKAVTYHRLSLEARDGVWRGTVILDV